MKIYSDETLNNLIDSNSLDLGEVPAGESKDFTFYIVNDSKAYLKALQFNVNHNEVKIVEAPETLEPNEKHKLTVKWSPSMTIKEGLHTSLSIEGKEVWK